MASSLKNLSVVIGANVEGLKKGLNDANNEIKKSERDWKRSFGAISAEMTKMGKSMVIIGGAITAAFALSVKAAEEERVNISLLEGQLKNVGVAYDDVKDSLEAVISATQNKTGVADSEQREVLGRLLLVTNDYNKALELLPLTLDLAAAGQMDATTAATYLSKAYLDLENGAESVTVRLGQASMQFEDLAALEERVGGAAEASANMFNVVKLAVGDLAEAIGTLLLPIIRELITNNILPLITTIKTWTEEHPQLAKTLVLVAAGIGAVTLAIGTLLIITPAIIHAIIGIGAAMNTSLGVIGLVSLAIMGIVAAAIAIKTNWGPISAFFIKAWSDIKVVFLSGVNAVLGYLEKFLGWIPGIGNKIRSARESISSVIDAEKIKRNQQAAEDVIEEFVDEAIEQKQRLITYDAELEKEKYNNAVKNLNAYYGETEKTDNSLKALAKQVTKTVLDELDKQSKAAEDFHDDNIKGYQNDTKELINQLNARTKATVKGLQDQMDALDGEAEAVDRAEEDAQRAAERSALLQNVANTGGNQSAWDALFAYEAETAKIIAKREREDKKASLQDEITAVQDAANDQIETWQLELKAFTENEDDKLEKFQESNQHMKDIADTALTESLTRIESEKQALIAAKQAELAAILTVEEAKKGKLNYGGMQTPTIDTGTGEIGGGNISLPSFDIPDMDTGGIVRGPGLVGIGAGVETVFNGLNNPVAPGKIEVNIQGGNFMANEADARRWARLLVDKIREDNSLQNFGRLA